MNEYLDELDSIAKQMLQKKQKIEKKKQQLSEDKELLDKLVRQFFKCLEDVPERVDLNDAQKTKDQNEQHAERFEQIFGSFLSCLDGNSAQSNLQLLGRQWKRFLS